MKKYIDYLREFIGLGSSGGGGGGFMPSGTINITKNGQHKVTQYTDAVVNVPNPSKGTLSIDENGTYDVTTKASVEVSVPPYGDGTKTIKRNNANENVNTYATANVQVQGGDDGTTSMPVTCPSGYTEIRTTETFLESTVNSWKAGSRTPALRCGADVTVVKGDKCGYIGIKQGTAYEFCVYGTVYSVSNYTSYKRVTITIEGVIRGDDPTITITANGTYNMKARESAIVNVPGGGYPEPTGSKTITANGTYDVKDYASAIVNVSSSNTTLKALIENTLTELNDTTITTIRNNAFMACTSLKNVVFTKVTRLNPYSFSGCTALESVDLGYNPSTSSQSDILANAFNSCSKLQTLILRRTNKQWYLSGSLTGTMIASGTGYIYVPSALVEGYKTASNWKTYANQFRALEDYTVDGTTTGALDPNKI